MNICFLMGKIISDVEFKFIINDKKYNSISIFKLKIDENCILTIKSYNEMADYCFKNLIKSNYIAIYGKINSKMEVILRDLTLI